MTFLNHITLEALPRLPIAEIVALPAGELARLQREADDALRKAKFTVTWLDNALTQKYADRARQARAEGEDPRDYVEVSLKVSERKYGSWPTHIRSLFEPSRTVRAGKETFELIVEQEGV